MGLFSSVLCLSAIVVFGLCSCFFLCFGSVLFEFGAVILDLLLLFCCFDAVISCLSLFFQRAFS